MRGRRRSWWGAPPKSQPAEVTEEHLQELERLADTAGVEVLDSFVQRLSLIAVAAVGHLEVLRGLHGEVIVPQAVWGEVTKPHRPVVIVVSALLSGQRWS